MVSLAPELVSTQAYDVAIEMKLPRTPDNTGAGNFMLEVSMFAPQEKTTGSVMETVQAGVLPQQEAKVLATSRRPAILPFRSTGVEMLYKLTEVHWYLMGLREESELLRVPMFEGVEFAKGWRNVPATLRLEVQSTHRLQIYAAKAVFRAKFSGLRWWMHNYRLLTAVLFISGFWATEMLFAGLAWGVVALSVYPRTQAEKSEEVHEVAEKIKRDPDARADADDEGKLRLSDTERTFPTLSSQQPLRYTSPRIKQEDEETSVVLPADGTAQPLLADDEDDEVDSFVDSGLGTSLEGERGRRESVRRRGGRMGMKEDGFD